MRNRFIALALLSTCAFVTTITRPGAHAGDLAPQHVMDRAAADGTVSVIVEIGGMAPTPEHQLSHSSAVAGQRLNIRQGQADVRRALRGLAHRVRHEYASMPYMVIEVSPDALRVLGTMHGIVTRIEEDIDLYPLLVESVPLVQAPTAWAAGGDGQGTVIAVIDAGVDRNHPFLHGKVVEEACYVRGADGAGGAGECPNGLDSQLGLGSAQPCPSCTHGTHVAGIAGGNGGPPANVAFSGVAPGAKLMAIRISSAAGPASASDVLAGLERVYLLRHTYNFAAVNMSLGVPGFGRVTTCDDLLPAMTTIIQNLKAAGIATVIASGNDGFANAVSFPACIGAAVSVASSDDGSSGVMLDTVSYFSNVAPFVSLLAPGQWITSSVLPGGDYGAGRGTSMAAPHVAAALAIMKQVAPAGSVTQFVDALRSTGVATVDAPSIERPDAQGTTVPRIRIADALAALPTVRFAAAAFSVPEAGTATITVTRSGLLADGATVHYATTNGTALGGTHYTPASGTLTFNAGEASRTFTVATSDNPLVNPDRTVNLTLGSPNGLLLGVPSTAVLTIANNDEGGVLAFAASNVQIAENGGAATIEVVRTGANLAGGVTVRFATTNGTAIAGSAYTATSGTLTFPAGATSATFTVPILDNTVFGGDRTFQVTLSSPGGGATLATPATASVTIQENDTPGSFQFSSATYAATEGGPAASITVTRTGTNLAGGVTIAYATSDGTATAGTDYTAKAGTLTFAAGVTSMVFTVAIANDAIIEPAETVNLTLAVPAGSPAVLGAPTSAVLTIQDDDGPGFRFSVASQSVAEGGSASVVVVRTGSLTTPASVDYQVAGGTASGGGVDFTLANGTLSFATGQASKTIVVPTVNDTLFEGPETIVLQLANPTGGATIGTPASTTLTIIDNDTAGTVQFGAAAYSVAENVPGGSINLLVTRAGTNLASGIVVSYTVTGGTATNGVDYTLANGALTFGAGQTSLPIPVLIHNDSAPEGNETVAVTLSSSQATLGANRVTTLTILDDEPALTFSAAAYTATEGTASMAIPILRAGPTPAGTTVTCQSVAGGSAVPDVDYRAVSTTLTFAAGSRMVTCTVPLLNDTVVDGPRTINLALSVPPTSPGMLGAPATAVLTLNDNDQGGTIRFGAATYTVAEGGTASLTVLRSGANLASAVTVDYTVTGGSALGGGTDYTLVAGTLSFTAGLTSRTIAVPTVNDSLVEGPETVVVTLSNPTGGAALGAPAVTTLTIADNDTAGTVQFGAAAYSVPENIAGGVYNLLVTRTGSNLASGIVVSYTVTGGTATNGGDYTLADGTLTFGAGQTSLPIPMLIHNDSDVEANKTVVVTLSSATATLGAKRVTTVTILDDEQVVTFGAAAYAVTEGGVASMAIPILRAGPTPAGTTVTCRTVAGGSAVPDVDYRAVNTTLTFAAGARSVSCVVPILNDTLVDGARTVNLALGVSPGGSALLGVQSAAVLTLNDNDQGGTIRFGAATYTVAEGGIASLTVLRSGANLASAVTVDYTVTGGSALGGGTDYTLGAGTLSFTAGLTSRTIAVPTVNDSLVEGPETVVVTLSNPTGGAALGAPAVTTLTITDNDTAGTVQFGAAAFSVPENVVGGVYNLPVMRTGSNLASGIVVSYTVTGGTATNGGDYTLADGTLTFGAGQTSLPIPVLIHNDSDVEANKTVVVTLSSATATLGANRVTTLTILDDE